MFLDLAMPVKVDLSSQSWRVIPPAIMIKPEGVVVVGTRWAAGPLLC